MNAPKHDLEAIRRAVPIEELVRRVVKLQRAGRGWKGLCPFHQEKTPSFTVSPEKGYFHCFGCGAHGDIFAWVMACDGVGFREAADRLAAQAGNYRTAGVPERKAAPERHAVHDMVDSADVGRFIWNGAGPARGEIVENWLRARGLDVEGIAGAIDRLRFHPRCPVVPWRVNESAADARITAPAMVAPISDEMGRVWGVHVTYLAADGKAKARLPKTARCEERPTRKIWGRTAGLAVWLTESPGDGVLDGVPLIVGEGIETTWSWAERQQAPVRAAAALSLNNLSGIPKKLRDGSLPLWRPEIDPERAMFTVQDPGEVVLLVDADMKPLRDQKVQVARGEKPVRADISSLERSRLCATLATQAWRHAGARKVTAIRPPMGKDFNDLAMEEAG
jgi:DNA primase